MHAGASTQKRCQPTHSCGQPVARSTFVCICVFIVVFMFAFYCLLSLSLAFPLALGVSAQHNRGPSDMSMVLFLAPESVHPRAHVRYNLRAHNKTDCDTATRTNSLIDSLRSLPPSTLARRLHPSPTSRPCWATCVKLGAAWGAGGLGGGHARTGYRGRGLQPQFGQVGAPPGPPDRGGGEGTGGVDHAAVRGRRANRGAAAREASVRKGVLTRLAFRRSPAIVSTDASRQGGGRVR